MSQRIKVGGGKYEFVRDEQTQRVQILRYGEPWIERFGDFPGDNAFHALLSAALQYRNFVAIQDPFEDKFAASLLRRNEMP